MTKAIKAPIVLPDGETVKFIMSVLSTDDHGMMDDLDWEIARFTQNTTGWQGAAGILAVIRRRLISRLATLATSPSPPKVDEGMGLTARVQELEEALKPFADVGNEWGRTHGDAYRFTLIDLRRAQKAMEKKP